MRIHLLTCRDLPEPDPDEAPLLAALIAAGAQASTHAWTDPPPPAGLGVLRSTWDYTRQLPAFLQALEAWGARLHNPLPVVRWNTDKTYLRDLAAAGLPVVPTLVARPGARLAPLAAALGWQDLVIKPAVGAGSSGARRVRPDDEGEAHLARLLARGQALVQPYQPAVEASGERAVVWIDGQITHAVRKSPRFEGDRECVSEAVPVAADEAAVARAALAVAEAITGARLLYGRIDLVRDAAGQPRLMELELVEPSLFLRQCPEAMVRFVEAMVRESEL